MEWQWTYRNIWVADARKAQGLCSAELATLRDPDPRAMVGTHFEKPQQMVPKNPSTTALYSG